MQLWRPEFKLDRINSDSWYQCLPIRIFIGKDMSLIVRGRLYSSCVRSRMLQGSEIWPVWTENKVALQRAYMRMVSWTCDIKDRCEWVNVSSGTGSPR